MRRPKTDEVLLKNGPTQWLFFRRPIRIVTARLLDEIRPALRDIERAAASGLYAAGFLTYEAAPAFDAALATCRPGNLPFVWFGVYDEPATVAERDFPCPKPPRCAVWQLNLSREEYAKRIARIRRYIEAGDTYQVNYTLRLQSRRFPAKAGWPFFLNTFLSLDSGYSAYIETEDFAVASGSPELFFEREGERITVRPMKGTIRRGASREADSRRRRRLRESQKDRAENVMIVDMIRNDLGRIARPGSVRPTRLFEIEQYADVWQMTSTVTARVGAGIEGTFETLFPCASVTGAPKVRTMQIIRELERQPRGIYTGAIGYVAPGGKARFNVAIRTLSIDKRTQTAEYGTGGGIVWDSKAALEFAECEAKALALTAPRPSFCLVETLLFEPGKGMFLLEEHLRRLTASARYFRFACDAGALRKALKHFSGKEFVRVRVLLARDGLWEFETTRLGRRRPLESRPWKLRLAEHAVRSDNPFLYHKTTHRAVYEQALNARADADDVVLFNERGEVTETTVANIVFETAGRKVTPPVACGLLNGTLRRHLLKTGQIAERKIPVAALNSARRMWLINSVRGWIPASLCSKRPPTEHKHGANGNL